MRASIVLFLLLFGLARGSSAQEPAVIPLTRAQAVDGALRPGPRLGLAVADTAVAFADLLSARAIQNPTLTTEYTKSTPQFHLTADLPFDYPFLRGSRIRTAEAARQAAGHRFAFERAVIG